jgi:hypothetical protein
MRTLQLVLAAFVVGALSSAAEAQNVAAATESC